MVHRRNLLAAGLLVSAATQVRVLSAQEKKKQVTLGVMGLSRGQSLAMDFARFDGVEVKYLCDVDQKRASNVGKLLAEQTGKEAQVIGDFRKILEDATVDALVCAAPNHWHGPATIMACKAGKHVYVEKPCSHNPQEGEWMVAAAKKFGRCVQMGTQRRSEPSMQEGMEKLHGGALGNVHLARCYYNGLRPSIGIGAEAKVPDGIDYELWQGPAPHKPFRDNYLPYNWHWFWHWGGGELANNGVHGLDICRWGMHVDYPKRVVSSGGRYWFKDDQETPDTHSVCFEFDSGKQITWDSLSCNKHSPGFFCCFYGDAGTMEVQEDGTYVVFDKKDEKIDEGKQPARANGQVEHLQNFIAAIRANDPSQLNQPILEGHKSTLLCHLGNIAYRTGQTVNCDPANGHVLGDKDQQALWQREYDPNWREAVTVI